jgi:hypothetical protein
MLRCLLLLKLGTKFFLFINYFELGIQINWNELRLD